jgi:polyhydroxyalkanoate synthase
MVELVCQGGVDDGRGAATNPGFGSVLPGGGAIPTFAELPAFGAMPALGVPTLGALPTFDPQQLVDLNAKYQAHWQALWTAALAALGGNSYASGTVPDIAQPAAGDRRFAAAEWRDLPYFALIKQAYLLQGRYLQELATLASLPEHEKQRLAFLTKQYVDALAPTNFMATNPEALKRALETEGASLVQGLANLFADAQRGRITMSDEKAFEVGRNLAVTPGSVVFRNELIELLQYAPTTERVHRRPLVIVPPCINKYYVLDLQPENSFARWAVGEGYTVFMISWRNIPPELGQTSWDDYLEQGVRPAIGVAREISGENVNALGFCVGGTLLASALAVAAGRKEPPVASLTLLTTMLDFEDPGEIGVYVTREALAAREPALRSGQRVRGSELGRRFREPARQRPRLELRRPQLPQGETPPAFDLLHWNGDSANLPGPMYVDYIRNMYLDNKLCKRGALTMAGQPDRPAAPRDAGLRLCIARGSHRAVEVGLPVHPSPRRRRHVRARASGHIAGVVNPPEKKRRNYWTNPKLARDPDEVASRNAQMPAVAAGGAHWGAWLGRGMRRVAAQRHARGPWRAAAIRRSSPPPGRYVRESLGVTGPAPVGPSALSGQ